MADAVFLITCEHAVNHVPDQWRHLFRSRDEILETHRASDSGALELARFLAGILDAPCFEAGVTRLLIDHNRSPGSRHRWSEFSRSLTETEKQKLVDNYYNPFRQRVGEWITRQHQKGLVVVHLSAHSFTPILKGKTRQADIGFLYEPGRREESNFARRWKKELEKLAPEFRVRLNYPYRGASDCHQRTYRHLYSDKAYLAFELEVNQALAGGSHPQLKKLQGLLLESIPEKFRHHSA